MNRSTIYTTDRPLKSVQTRPLLTVLGTHSPRISNTGGNTEYGGL